MNKKAAALLSLILLLPAAGAFGLEGLVPRFTLDPCEIELRRAAQPNTYFDKVGRKFALLGTESGVFEAWAYPLKLVRNFEFSFLLGTGTTPLRGRDLVRSISVTPASTTLTFVYQSFTVRAIFVAAIDQPGAVILLAVDSVEPLTVVCGFLPVLQPMWPAGLGGQYASWNKELKAYVLSEPTRKNHGVVGSPAAEGISSTPAHMLSDTPHEFKVVVSDPKEVEDRFIPVILAGGRGDREAVLRIYRDLASGPEGVYRRAEAHYRELLGSTMRLRTPDAEINLAWEYAKVAYDNLVVDNPDLGLGMVAGLGISGTSGRPGFGWFFGGDAYLNSFSLLGFGSFETVRDVLAFTRRWQRADGKMAHELSQSAAFVRWFEDYPYGYIHADTTPLYLVAVDEYCRFSGDAAFLRESWPSLRKAFDWCLSTDADADGLMDNKKAGLGALEFGSLTGIQTDIFLAAVWCRAARAMEHMAGVLGESGQTRRARAAADKAAASFHSRFWDQERGLYVYAFNAGGEKVREITPWPSFGLAWGLGGSAETQRTLERLSRPDLLTDWGVRMMSAESPYFEPLNYNYGAVWPFLTGWLATALYKNERPLQGYAALMSNVRHTFDNALGAVTELFSGAQNIWPAEGVAHQGFSTGGVVLPLVKGLLGLEADASARTLVLRPAFPADWREVSLENIRAGGARFDIRYERGEKGVTVRVAARQGEGWTVALAPAFGPGLRVRDVRLNGVSRPFLDSRSERAVRPEITFQAGEQDEVEFDVLPGVEILPPVVRCETGAPSRGLRVESISGDERRLEILAWGFSGSSYELPLTNGGRVRSVEGAALEGDLLKLEFPAEAGGKYVSRKVILKLE